MGRSRRKQKRLLRSDLWIYFLEASPDSKENRWLISHDPGSPLAVAFCSRSVRHLPSLTTANPCWQIWDGEEWQFDDDLLIFDGGGTISAWGMVRTHLKSFAADSLATFHKLMNKLKVPRGWPTFVKTSSEADEVVSKSEENRPKYILFDVQYEDVSRLTKLTIPFETTYITGLLPPGMPHDLKSVYVWVKGILEGLHIPFLDVLFLDPAQCVVPGINDDLGDSAPDCMWLTWGMERLYAEGFIRALGFHVPDPTDKTDQLVNAIIEDMTTNPHLILAKERPRAIDRVYGLVYAIKEEFSLTQEVSKKKTYQGVVFDEDNNGMKIIRAAMAKGAEEDRKRKAAKKDL